VETSYGPPLETMKAAIKAVESEHIRITESSRHFDTPAFPAGSGPNFVNGVFAVSTSFDASELLAHLHRIEAEFGRKRTTRWGARTLDLDILAVGQEIRPNRMVWDKWFQLPPELQASSAPEELILPHPRMQDRGFVLVPLCDVASDWIHPILDKTAQQLCDDLPENVKNEVKPL